LLSYRVLEIQCCLETSVRTSDGPTKEPSETWDKSIASRSTVDFHSTRLLDISSIFCLSSFKFHMVHGMDDDGWVDRVMHYFFKRELNAFHLAVSGL
jgi:hypothetical protein